MCLVCKNCPPPFVLGHEIELLHTQEISCRNILKGGLVYLINCFIEYRNTQANIQVFNSVLCSYYKGSLPNHAFIGTYTMYSCSTQKVSGRQSPKKHFFLTNAYHFQIQTTQVNTRCLSVGSIYIRAYFKHRTNGSIASILVSDVSLVPIP